MQTIPDRNLSVSVADKIIDEVGVHRLICDGRYPCFVVVVVLLYLFSIVCKCID